GPYISKLKRGIHNPNVIREPLLKEVEEYIQISENKIKIITLAPELEGATDFISSLAKYGVILSVGHSNATYAETMKGIEKGISYATHTFNAMRGLHHRESGPLGAILIEKGVYAEIIADGIHVSPEVIRLLVKAKGIDGIILVTDACEGAGLAEGEYLFNGEKIIVKSDQAVTENNILAGSIITMDLTIKNMLNFTKEPLKNVLKMATYNPAKVLGIEQERGHLAKGKIADILLLDKDLRVKMIFKNGTKNG
ncbi:MAG: N-acetylglucosamine-6-phosphate deacetylase, partial [bacterium]